MVTVPTYPPALSPTIWNTFAAQLQSWLDGFTDTGTFVNILDYLIHTENVAGTDYYYANNAFQTIYGGPSDAGAIDGEECELVIQACIDDLTSGGNIGFAAGTYPIQEQAKFGDYPNDFGLLMGSGVSLIGFNPLTTIIQRDFAEDGTNVFVEARGKSNIRIQGLTWDCDSCDYGLTFGGAAHLAGVPFSDNVTIQDCIIDNIEFWGVSFTEGGEQSPWVQNDNVQFIHNYLAEGTDVAHGDATCFIVKNSRIDDNFMYGMHNSWGMLLYESDYSTINRNVVYSLGNTVSMALASCQYCEASGNKLYGENNRGGAPLQLVKEGDNPGTTRVCTDNLVSGNTIADGSTLYGIKVETSDSHRQTIVNNIINLVSAGYGGKGIWFDAYDHIVMGNRIRNAADGIVEVADYNTIMGNTIHGDVTTPATIGGTHSMWRNNRGFVTENTGIDTITNGNTSVVVAHGCGYTPVAGDITITGTNQPTNDIGNVFVTAIGAANMTVNVKNDPGANNFGFHWTVRRI